MNYKIRITDENQAIVKRIADENGMNLSDDDKIYFTSIGHFYNIVNGIFNNSIPHHSVTEVTTDQFIELFDKKETELDKWIRETKAKNLSLEELDKHIDHPIKTDRSIYRELKGEFSKGKAQILFNQWNSPTEESPKVETEWQPKRGDRVLVWNAKEEDAVETIHIFTDLNSKHPYYCVSPQDLKEYKEEELYYVWGYKHMKPLPIEDKVVEAAHNFATKEIEECTSYHDLNYGFTEGAKWQSEQPKETDLKSKVIELIEKRIENQETNIQQYYEIKQYHLLNLSNTHKIIYQDLLNQIKQL